MILLTIMSKNKRTKDLIYKVNKVLDQMDPASKQKTLLALSLDPETLVYHPEEYWKNLNGGDDKKAQYQFQYH